ncbi:Hydroxylamine oxidoreductase (Fragment) [hydrothermal vent metagenome]|uniref:Hydroxylamine oxidoreductase n=1 Tax=hydrothermal vent metagenome TaxID=652676 RepID=A0A3B1CEP5_9ZZZZ
MKKLHLIMFLFLLVGFFSSMAAQDDDVNVADNCITCHKEKSPGIYKQWEISKHAENDVTCLDCHEAESGDKDGFDHEGALIATLVTPKDCGGCHSQEADEVNRSYHATAGKILESKDAYLAYVGGGTPAVIAGCESCHGSKMLIDENSPNKLSSKTWPNSGIGRINPDGSLGSCTACHTRHTFKKSQARQPEACSKCHLGPDHPQKEIYEESKHGNVYYTNKDEMNLKSESWVVGVDYFEAPTCATCHMSATPNQKLTHDVGDRISWTLRPPVSKYKDNHEQKRKNMEDVCAACHTERFMEGHFVQFDALVRLYNEKFAKPATAIMKIVNDKKLKHNKANFANDIDWIYWELWHHEGRRARHGAAMMGPDYTWWHGIYDVIKNFYFEFIPAAKEFNDTDVNAAIDKLMNDDPMHQWFLTKTTAELKEAINNGEMEKIYSELFDEK